MAKFKTKFPVKMSMIATMPWLPWDILHTNRMNTSCVALYRVDKAMAGIVAVIVIFAWNFVVNFVIINTA
jgi:hypothetical protein